MIRNTYSKHTLIIYLSGLDDSLCAIGDTGTKPQKEELSFLSKAFCTLFLSLYELNNIALIHEHFLTIVILCDIKYNE